MIETHSAPRRLLARAMSNGRLAHAYLLEGPEGAGKRTLAFEFAASLVCEKRLFPPCRGCGSCRRVLNGTHPDVIRVEAEGRNIKIEDIRNLSSRFRLHSFEGGYKIGIIPEAELMNEASQNAFLKTLEEPPADTVLIMTTTNLVRLLPTIISRCQVMRLGPLPDRVIVELLKEERGLDDEQAGLVAALAQGNARKALDMELDFVVGFRKELVKALLKLSTDNFTEMLHFAESASKCEHPMEAVLDLLSGFYRDVLYYKLGIKRLQNQDLEPEIAGQAQQGGIGAVLNQMEMIHQARLRALGNANPRLNWELLTMALAGVEGAEITAS